MKGEDTKKSFRVLQLRGDREKVQNAEIRMLQFISEIPKVIETEILVPQGACGHIIGKGGDNIRELSSISGTCIFVFISIPGLQSMAFFNKISSVHKQKVGCSSLH